MQGAAAAEPGAAVPLIAGGLLSDKADVLAALGAGALCVSASDESLWAL